MKKTIIITIALLSFITAGAQDKLYLIPDITAKYAVKGDDELYLDIYEPAAGSETEINGVEKPTVIFLFGGGFVGGSRDSEGYLSWIDQMTKRGFRIVSIDYRLGLRGVTKIHGRKDLAMKMGNAIEMAVEDLFSATAYLLDNCDELCIDCDKIVICGSSAGAITSLQAEYELCNREESASILPEGFNYAGVMAYSGAIFLKKGKLNYEQTPAPVLLLHGDEDPLVPYNQIRAFGMGFYGPEPMVKLMKDKGYNYKIYRYIGQSHEVAEYMDQTIDKQVDFLTRNVMERHMETIDCSINDPLL